MDRVVSQPPAAGGHTGRLGLRPDRAVENGVTRERLNEAITRVRLNEAITRVTLYAGRPRGMAAIRVAKQLFTDNHEGQK